MNKKITWILLSFLLIFTASAWTISNSDMVKSANKLADMWIINNHSDSPSEYNLSDNVLRQEIAKMSAFIAQKNLWLQLVKSCENKFWDITKEKPNDWVCIYVESLVKKWLISANKAFNPENFISKTEALKMMLEAAWFTDIYSDASKWQEQVVWFAVERWILDSFSDYNTLATRGFIFTIADATIKKEEEIRKQKQEWFYSDEVLYEIESILSIYQ